MFVLAVATLGRCFWGVSGCGRDLYRCQCGKALAFSSPTRPSPSSSRQNPGNPHPNSPNKINAAPTRISPPSPPSPTLTPSRHRIHRVCVPGEVGSALRGSGDRRPGPSGSAENGLPWRRGGKVSGLWTARRSCRP